MTVPNGVRTETGLSGSSQTRTICQESLLGICINFRDLAMLSESSIFLVESVSQRDPDTTGTSPGRKAKGRVRSPVSCDLVENDVLGQQFHIGGGDTFPKPSGIHLGGFQSVPRIDLGDFDHQ